MNEIEFVNRYRTFSFTLSSFEESLSPTLPDSLLKYKFNSVMGDI